MAIIKKSLTDKEIEQLFDFVKSKYVRYEDLQHEIVDHLACNIEELIAEDNNLTFETALQKVYSKFPVTGFSKLVEQKTIGLQKYWKTRFWKYLKSYFRLPKILILLTLTMLFYKILPRPLESIQFKTFYFVFIMIVWFSMIFTIKTNYKILRSKFLIIDSYFKTIFIDYLFYMAPIYFLPNNIESPLLLIIVSLFCALSILLNHAKIFVFPKMLEEEFKQNYMIYA